MGRKLILLLSAAGMAVAMVILGISFSLLDEDKKSPGTNVTKLFLQP
jgi:hypothetical protein